MVSAPLNHRLDGLDGLELRALLNANQYGQGECKMNKIFWGAFNAPRMSDMEGADQTYRSQSGFLSQRILISYTRLITDLGQMVSIH